jgi:carbamoyl-phosphate synthase large subunit
MTEPGAPSEARLRRPWRVLVFPGGMENGLEIRESLQYAKEVELVSASSDMGNHAPYAFRAHRVVRDVRTSGWLDDLNTVVRELGVDWIYPANSFVIDALDAVRDELACRVVLPSREVLAVTRSKRRTIACLREVLPVPAVYATVEEIPNFPVFAKPDRGYGAQGARVLDDVTQARSVNFTTDVVQELLPGREYTVDCFTSRHGALLFAGARERSRVRMATAMHAESVTPELQARLRGYAERILTRIPITGAWFFQVKEDAQGICRLLEIDVRIAGTMAYHRCQGVNFPLLTLFDHMGEDVQVMPHALRYSLDRSLRNRYLVDVTYDTVYVDLDDTILVHGALNLRMISYLYQCVNTGRRLVLVSKHTVADRDGLLARWRLDTLFDDVIWLDESQSKADVIRPAGAIFIDDSFSQRREVAQRHGIPTFDPSMIEMLLDDRA